LCWALENTREFITEGFTYWASQGASYYKQLSVFKHLLEKENYNLKELGISSL
jgi:hypothetical protein